MLVFEPEVCIEQLTIELYEIEIEALKIHDDINYKANTIRTETFQFSQYRPKWSGLVIIIQQ